MANAARPREAGREGSAQAAQAELKKARRALTTRRAESWTIGMTGSYYTRPPFSTASAKQLADSIPHGRLLDALRLQRDRAARVASVLAATERALLLQYRAEVHRLEAVRRFALARVAALQSGGVERFPHELSAAHEALAAVAFDLPRAVAGYAILGFAGGERRRFVVHPEEREVIIDGVLSRGFVADESHRIKEIEGLL